MPWSASTPKQSGSPSPALVCMACALPRRPTLWNTKPTSPRSRPGSGTPISDPPNYRPDATAGLGIRRPSRSAVDTASRQILRDVSTIRAPGKESSMQRDVIGNSWRVVKYIDCSANWRTLSALIRVRAPTKQLTQKQRGLDYRDFAVSAVCAVNTPDEFSS